MRAALGNAEHDRHDHRRTLSRGNNTGKIKGARAQIPRSLTYVKEVGLGLRQLALMTRPVPPATSPIRAWKLPEGPGSEDIQNKRVST